jgi:hypothetical protein
MAIGDHRSVHRAGAGPADALDDDPLIPQQTIEHAPGEGAMSTAALERQIDRFDGWVAHDVELLQYLIWRP